MAEKATIARPYAKAAFEHARATGDFARWSKILAAAAAVVQDEQVRNLLGNPRVTSADLVSLIAEVCGDALGWSPARRRDELRSCARTLRERHHVRLTGPDTSTETSTAWPNDASATLRVSSPIPT